MSKFGLKKLNSKNWWNLSISLFIYCWKVIKHKNFIDFSSAIFWAQMCSYLHFSYYWCALKEFLPIFITFYQFLHTFNIFYQLLYYIYHLLPTFNTFCHCLQTFIPLLLTFYYLLPTLYYFLSIWNGSIFFFSFIFWYASISPSSWIPC